MVCRALRVVGLVMSGVKLAGFVKYLLNALPISLLVVVNVLLNFIERFGSLEMGSLLLRDLNVFH